MYFVRQAVYFVCVLLVVSFLTFLFVRLLPGDPVLSITGVPQAAADDPQYADLIATTRDDLNLDDPIPVAYVKWVGDLLPPDVDLGFSYVRNTPVDELLGTALPRTGLLMLYSTVVSLLVAVPLGVLAAYRGNGWVDRLISSSAFGIVAIPNFVIAVVLVYAFSVKLGWFPASGVVDLGDGSLVDHVKSHVLPVLSLSLGQAAVFARLLRTDMVTTLQADYVDVARAKGMPVRRILWAHALRPSSFTLLTVIGLNVGQLLGGAVVVEFLFNINGMGSQLAAAVLRSDYVVVQTGVVLIATCVVVLNATVDVLYGVLDPRVRRQVA